MAMRDGVLPKTLHVDEPSPNVDWEAGEIELLTEPAPWGRTGRPRRAGVSSFGISGTNAHVILEEAPAARARRRSDEAPPALPGRDPLVALGQSRAGAARGGRAPAAHLRDNPDLDPADVAYSLATTRAAFEHRAVVVGADREELLDGLTPSRRATEHPRLAGSAAPARPSSPSCSPARAPSAPAWAGSCYEASPALRRAPRRGLRAALDPHLDWPLKRRPRGDEEGACARATPTYAQPALFAIEVALAELWRRWGVEPDSVAGHSIGEIAAAHVAGVLSLPDARQAGRRPRPG